MRSIDPETLRHHLQQLSLSHPDRHVGGPGNRAACERFCDVTRAAGFSVERRDLPCVVWERGHAELRLADAVLPLQPGPYSLPCAARAPLHAAGTLEELQHGEHQGTVLLLHGDLVREQLMPKNYVFYNPASHRRLVAALEAARPAAIVAATGQNPELAGGPYPFPLVADGDFGPPSAFLKDVDGVKLLPHVGEAVELVIASDRRAATTPQPIARKPGRSGQRLVFFAHIDSQYGTPGALDNAAGVVVLLALAELLAEYAGPHELELAPLNGEDDYAATGQLDWIARNQGRTGSILLGVNVDGPGFAGHGNAVSFYGCSPALRRTALTAMTPFGLVEGPSWPQGDHSLLVQQGVPALAITSQDAFFVASTVAHTARDLPALVDPAALACVARAVSALVLRLSRAEPG